MVSNPGLPMTAALHYLEYHVMYSAVDRVECVVDGAPPGKNGRLFIVEPGKPTKVPWAAAKFMLDHLGYTGVVVVPEYEKTDEDGNVIGIEYDIATAKAESEAKTVEQDEWRWRRFVNDMVEDFVKKGKPVPPPPEAINRIIIRRGYKMQDYGIKPIGFKDPIDERNEAIIKENAELKAQMKVFQAQMDLLIKQGAAKDAAKEAAKDAHDNADVHNVPTADRAGTGRKPRGAR